MCAFFGWKIEKFVQNSRKEKPLFFKWKNVSRKEKRRKVCALLVLVPRKNGAFYFFASLFSRLGKNQFSDVFKGNCFQESAQKFSKFRKISKTSQKIDITSVFVGKRRL